MTVGEESGSNASRSLLAEAIARILQPFAATEGLQHRQQKIVNAVGLGVFAVPDDFPAARYRETYPDLEHLTDREAFRHFLVFGLKEGRRLPLDWLEETTFLTKIVRQFAVRNPELSRAAERQLKSLSLPGWSGEDARAYRRLNSDLSSLSDAALKTHFRAVGCRELRLVSPEYKFDPDFYRDYYPDLRALSDGDAYIHWIDFGRTEGRLPSEPLFCRQLALPVDRIPAGFQAGSYRRAYPELGGLSRTRLFEHLIQEGLAEGRNLPFDRAEDVGFLGALAASWSTRDATIAERCFQTALRLSPNNAELLARLGDFNLSRGHLSAALWQYEAAYRIRPDHAWTLINLGLVHEGLGDLDAAIEKFEQARRAKPDWTVTRRVLMAGAAKRLQARLALALDHARADDREAACEEVESATCQYLDLVDLADGRVSVSIKGAHSDPRIAFITGTELRQCILYRVDQKTEQARATGLQLDIFWLSEIDTLGDRLFEYDALWLYRAYVSPDILELIAAARRLGLAVIYETDDLMFEPGVYPPPHDSMRAFVSDQDYARLVLDAPSALAVLRLCDTAVASTPSLQRAMAPHTRSGRALLHRNGLSQVHERAMAERAVQPEDRDEIRVFYGSGSKSHNENFNAVAGRALARIMANDPRVRLMIVGDLDLDDCFDTFGPRVEHLPSELNVSDYWDLLREADINICPLTEGAFNDAKSEIKWLEAAMLGIPSIVSPTATYLEVVRDGDDGLTAADKAEWEAQLLRLCDDPTLRRRLGDAARARVRREYTLAALGENLTDVCKELTTQQEAVGEDDRTRILVVNVFFAPQSYGGATRVVEANIADIRALTGDAFHFEVFSSVDSGERPGALRTYDHDGVYVTAITVPDDPLAGPEERNVFVQDAFSRVLRRFQPDLVHIHCIQRLTASVVDATAHAGVPYVVTVHDGWWISDEQFLLESGVGPVYETGRWGGPRRLDRLRRALNGAVRVLAVSDSSAALYRERGIEGVVTCPNGVNDIEGPVEWPSGPQVRLGLLGGIGPAKGSELLRAALEMEHFENLHIVVVAHELQAGVETSVVWGLNEVALLGAVPQDRVASIYSRLHVVLAPSVCVESFGLVAREALSLGRWVVASDRGAIADEVSDGENGFRIDVSDCLGLLTALRTINRDPDRFLQPISKRPAIRPARDQARDLVSLYRGLLGMDTLPDWAAPDRSIRLRHAGDLAVAGWSTAEGGGQVLATRPDEAPRPGVQNS